MTATATVTKPARLQSTRIWPTTLPPTPTPSPIHNGAHRRHYRAANVTTVGRRRAETVKVVYSDNVAVAVNSITAGNITVIGPGGALTVTGVKTSLNVNAATITATYTVAAPGGGFVALDNGAYTVSLTSILANQVTDTSNHPASATPVTFTVNVHGIAPTAIVTAPNVTSAGGASETITVVYSDPSVVIDTTTIGAGNLTVTACSGGTPAWRHPQEYHRQRQFCHRHVFGRRPGRGVGHRRQRRPLHHHHRRWRHQERRRRHQRRRLDRLFRCDPGSHLPDGSHHRAKHHHRGHGYRDRHGRLRGQHRRRVQEH